MATYYIIKELRQKDTDTKISFEMSSKLPHDSYRTWSGCWRKDFVGKHSDYTLIIHDNLKDALDCLKESIQELNDNQ